LTSLRNNAVALVFIGLAAGTVSDRPQLQPPVQRDKYWVLAADLHVHSFLGDGELAPWDLALEARRRGLHVLAITNHNQVLAAKIGRSFSRLVGGTIVLVGEEITAPGFHIIAVGIEKPIGWRHSAAEVAGEIHRQNGVAIAAHPTKEFWRSFDEKALGALDGTEVMSPMAYTKEWRWKEMPAFYRRFHQIGLRPAAIGSSDYHILSLVGLCRTYVFAHQNSEAGVLDALRAGRTVVYDVEGKAWGDPAMIELLEHAPLEPERDRLHEQGHLAELSRVCGWLGMVCLIALGSTRKRSASRTEIP